MAASLAAQCAEIFQGLDRAHGKSVVGTKKSANGKMEARSWIELAPVTLKLWENHVAGKEGLGIIPIDDDACVHWGAIDIDDYDLDIIKLVERVEETKLPLTVFTTKSGGAHVFVFFKEPVSAQLVRTRLTEIAIGLNFPGVEVFPKQVALANEKDVGNWLNMPYFNGDKGDRYAIVRGKRLDLKTMITTVKKRQLTLKQFMAAVVPVSEEFGDGPPCLQQLATHGFPDGVRNNSLFNLAVYAKLKWPDAWKAHVEEFNHALMDPPLDSSEVMGIIKSLDRKSTYRYRCDDSPLCDVCNKGLCLARKYGVAGGGADEPHDVQVGGLTKFLTDPPLYFLDVDGHRIQLTTEELLDNGRFRKKCFEKLNKLPPRRKPATWDKVVQELATHCQEIDAPDDASPDGRVMQLLEDWCTQYAQAQTVEELLVGKPWTDDGMTYFRSRDFQKFIEHQGERDFRGRSLWSILRKHGAKHGAFQIDGRYIRYWAIPSFEAEGGELKAPRKKSEY